MDKTRRMIDGGAVAIAGGKIAAVGKDAEVLKEYEGEMQDCEGG